MKLVKTLGVLVLLILAAVVGYCYHIFTSSPLKPEVTSYTVTQVVREIPIQLVTNRVTTMVSATMADLPEHGSRLRFTDILLGTTDAVFMTRVRYSYGLDLKNDFSEKNVFVGSDDIVITLPEPKLLESAPDLNYRFFRRTPILRQIFNQFSNVNVEAQFREVFQQNMVRFAEENDLNPTKQEVIDNIGPFFNMIFEGKTDKRIVFE